jgi:hypothetical protein
MILDTHIGGIFVKINCIHSELRDVVNLVENPKNYNKHSDKQIDMLAKIMNFQGWRHPIVVSKRSGFIVAGHGRLMAAKKLGWDKCPIDLQDFPDEATELAFLVSDNKIAELAETDSALLLEITNELGDSFDTELLGLDIGLVNSVNVADENVEWSDLPDFVPGEKEIRLTILFNTELERENYVTKYEIPITNKHSGQWIYRV